MGGGNASSLDHQLIDLHSLRPTCQMSLRPRESRTGNRAGPQGSQRSLPHPPYTHSHTHAYIHAHTVLHLDLKHVKPCGPRLRGTL